MSRLFKSLPPLMAGVLTSFAVSASPMPALEFDASRYQLLNIEVDGKTLAIRAYEHIPYVTRPVDPAHQALNLYIPDAYFQGKSVGSFTAKNAPIFLPNQIGGYMPGEPATLDGSLGGEKEGRNKGQRPPRGGGPGGMGGPGGGMGGGPGSGMGGGAGMGPPPDMADGMGPPGRSGHGMPPADMQRPDFGNAGPSSIAQALAKGFVVASPGARGRTSKAEDGTWSGKAPAAIVDLKAAVRYLHFNDARMPGDASRIISNGTSAGGALSALLGASGNNHDYQPYLDALGAAPADDDIFAVSAYCPITNLEHADSAYEWLFYGVNDYRKIDMSMLDYKVQRKETTGTLSKAQIGISDALRQQFPAYLNSLALRDPNGNSLTLDSNGKGSFRDYLKTLVIASANQALAAGSDLSARPWLTLRDGKVVDIDFDGYVRYAGRMKLPPAFDALDLSSGENQLFGNSASDARHFTDFAAQRNQATNAGQADAQTVRMMNPMAYIGAPGTDTAKHWRIRQGTRDRDTSLAVPVILATALHNQGYAVDLALPWDRPHGGDYDLDELFAWMEQVALKP